MILRATTLATAVVLSIAAVAVTILASIHGADSPWEFWRLPSWIAAVGALIGFVTTIHHADAVGADERREVANALIYLDDHRARRRPNAGN